MFYRRLYNYEPSVKAYRKNRVMVDGKMMGNTAHVASVISEATGN